MKQKTVKASLASLVFDEGIYPRVDVDESWVRRLAIAIESGAKLPPIEVWKRNGKSVIVDGAHRRDAYTKLLGDDAEVDVVVLDFKNKKEALLYAASANVAHGRALAPYDEAHCVGMLRTLKVPDVEIAGVLSLTAERFATIVATKLAKMRGATVAIKRSVAHFAGQELPDRFRESQKPLGGMSPVYYANQLIHLMSHNLIDWSNEKLADTLRTLAKAITAGLKR